MTSAKIKVIFEFGLIQATHIYKAYDERTCLPQPTRLVCKCKFATRPKLGSATANTHQAQSKYLQRVVHCSCNHKPAPRPQCCPRLPFDTPTPLFPFPLPFHTGAIMRSHSQTHDSGSTLYGRPPRHWSSAYTWCIADESLPVPHRQHHGSTKGRSIRRGTTVSTCHRAPNFLFLPCQQRFHTGMWCHCTTLWTPGIALGPMLGWEGTLCLPLSLCLLLLLRTPLFLLLLLLGGVFAVLLFPHPPFRPSLNIDDVLSDSGTPPPEQAGKGTLVDSQAYADPNCELPKNERDRKKCFEYHFEVCRQMFCAFAEVGLTVKPSKCHLVFAPDQVCRSHPTQWQEVSGPF